MRHSYLDILQLQYIDDCEQDDKAFGKIDFECIVANFNGHTIFTLFQHNQELYEALFDFLTEYLVPTDQSKQTEISRKRLMYTLRQPTGAIAKDEEHEDPEEKEKRNKEEK